MARTVNATPEGLQAIQGQEAGVSDWIELSQERIDRFADVTGDHQWIHLDRERAERESPYGTTIAHGFLTLSLLSTLFRDAVTVEGGFQRMINYGLNRVRFPAPAPSGCRIRGRFELAEFRELPDGIEMIWKSTIEREGGGKPCAVAEWVLRGYR